MRSNLPKPVPTPLPPSTVKKSTNLRMSLAGPAMRGNMGPPMGPPGTVSRQSLYQSQNMNPLLASVSKGRTPMHGGMRRGSMWAGGMGMGPPMITPATAKDIRPLRDKSYQATMRQDVLAWLQGTGYDLTMSTLINITGKDFRAIFHHLVELLDPCYPFNPSLRIEEEIIPALKCLRYPYVNSIDSKWLAAPASMHSWPALLGVLHWLVGKGKGRLHYMESDHPTLQFAQVIPEEFDDINHHHALAFDYITEAYDVFLGGSDEYDTQKHALEERYARKDQRTAAELEDLSDQLSKVKREVDKLESSPPPIIKLRQDNSNLKRDRDKFQECVRRWESRKTNLIATIAKEKAEIDVQTKYLEELRAQQAKFADIVKSQGLSPDDIIAMNAEHDQLSRNSRDLAEKISSIQTEVRSAEVKIANQTAAAEEAIDAYNNLIANLGLFPPLPAPFEDIDLTLELNPGASNPQQLLKGEDIRRVIRKTLTGVADLKRTEREDNKDELIKVDSDLEQFVLDCENLDDEINEGEKKLFATNKQVDDLKESASREAMSMNQNTRELQDTIASQRTSAQEAGFSVKSELQRVELQYREQVERVARLRDDTVRAIVKNSSDVALFKEEVSQKLRHLRDMAETN
ncbi:HEC/Ndc80p family-domain-containing protein [Amylostereum chailletii]|nr:HEC/Ndc80p family-domain-containing protein [Amylostereum chailletii]